MSQLMLDELISYCSLNERVCPQPQKWNRLWKMLPDKQQIGARWEPALPLTLGAWYDTPALLKMARFREHIEWAHSHDVLEEIDQFLRSLTEDEWHHIGD